MKHGQKIMIVICVLLSAAVTGYVFWEKSPQEHKLAKADRCVSYSPEFLRIKKPKDFLKNSVTIRKTLDLSSDYASCVRLYDVVGAETVIREAGIVGLDVILGVELVKNHAKNLEKIELAAGYAKQFKNVIALMVGNEVTAKLEKKHVNGLGLDRLIGYLKHTKKLTQVPISTAERGDLWPKVKSVAAHVDFVSAHFIPFWYGVTQKESLGWLFRQKQHLQKMFPKKFIFIAETGWPSGGPRYGVSKPGLGKQFAFLDELSKSPDVNDPKSEILGYSYNVIEAFDQPWKIYLEGRNGMHWGLMYANLGHKFGVERSWHSSRNPYFASLLAFFFIMACHSYFLRSYFGMASFSGPVAAIFFVSVVGFAIIHSVFTLNTEYVFTSFASTLFVVLSIPIIFLAFVFLKEAFAMKPLPSSQGGKSDNSDTLTGGGDPFVSIHLPCCNEPPDLVIESIQSLLDLDYPHCEIVVVDNNTSSESDWTPVKEFCEKFPQKIKFFHLPKNPGFKAGALNFALEQTHARASIVGVIDSDYIVDKSWLKKAVPNFSGPDVAVVQHPQAYRADDTGLFGTMLNAEYRGFFCIGMVERSKQNAIIQHGTMTLVKKEALVAAGSWSEWCIVEDAELGVKLLSDGYRLLYFDEVLGRGVLPRSFFEYSKQRFRWAYGAVRITKAHLLPLTFGSKLNLKQKFHYWAGWLPWFMESTYIFIAVAALVMGYRVLEDPRYLPSTAYAAPILIYCISRMISTLITYRVRVSGGMLISIYSVVAATSLVPTISLAVLRGIFDKNMPFLITQKSAGFSVNKNFLVSFFYSLNIAAALLMLILAGLILATYGASLDRIVWGIAYAVLAFPGLSIATMLTIEYFAGRNIGTHDGPPK